MKLIFLDIEGVMTDHESAMALDMNADTETVSFTFTPRCVKVLNYILRVTGADIVITSTWRTVFDTNQQIELFRENGINKPPYGATLDLGYGKKNAEITNFLEQHPCDRYVILDDREIPGFPDNFIQIDGNLGLSRPYVDRILAILGEEEG